MAQLIDGRSLAAAIRAKLPGRVQILHRKPGLAVMIVGNNHASELYVKMKERAAREAGIVFTLERFPTNVQESALVKKIKEWNVDPRIDGILIQLPLPKGLHEDRVVETMEPEKDADGFHPVNTARFLGGERTNPPGLVEGIMRLIKSTQTPLAGLQAAIVARESVFTQCLQHSLQLEKVQTTITPTDGSHRPVTLNRDIVVVAAGREKLIVGDDLKPGAIVIDIGINEISDSQVVGDVDRTTAGPIAGWLSPVPGGVGPMTIAMLLENTVRLAERNQA